MMGRRRKFHDLKNRPILGEAHDSKLMERAEVQGEKTYHVGQQWLGDSDESLYGLGQLQLGALDIKGLDIDLWQHNTSVYVPFLVSSKGYGIFWDNTSLTHFGDRRPFEPIPADLLIDSYGHSGG